MNARLGSLVEVHEHWTLDDLLQAHEILDLKEKAQAQAEREAEQQRQALEAARAAR